MLRSDALVRIGAHGHPLVEVVLVETLPPPQDCAFAADFDRLIVGPPVWDRLVLDIY